MLNSLRGSRGCCEKALGVRCRGDGVPVVEIQDWWEDGCRCTMEPRRFARWAGILKFWDRPPAFPGIGLIRTIDKGAVGTER